MNSCTHTVSFHNNQIETNVRRLFATLALPRGQIAKAQQLITVEKLLSIYQCKGQAAIIFTIRQHV
jgi:hypothetical protein